MKCVCIDIETTGTDESKDVVLEVAGAVADLKQPLYSPLLNEFRILVMPERALTVDLEVLAMHAELWKELQSYRETMTDKDVLKVGESFFVVKKHKLLPIFGNFINAIKKEHFPGQKRVTHAGKNPDFDRRFLCMVNPEFSQFFYARKMDPGVLWLDENDTKVPDTRTCMDRMIAMFPGMPSAKQHMACEDNKIIAWLLRGGMRKLGLFGEHAPPKVDAKGHEWTDRANSGGVFPLVCSRCGAFSGTPKAGSPCELGKNVSF